ncbi:MAG: zinc-dependent dehydrogenase [Spirochaetota bacterium]
MQAGVFSGIGRVECSEVQKPAIGENEVLVRVKAAAICGTDLRIFKNGHFKIKEGQKRILGHEFSGVIEEVGSGVHNYQKGMKVGVAPNIGCGTCRYCRMGCTHMCPDYEAFGISLDGGFAEYVRITQEAVQQGNLVPFTREEISFEKAALAEPLSCCYNAYRAVNTRPGDIVLIVGAGPMGALHLMLNRLVGAAKILVADIAEYRLGLFERFSPDAVINSTKEDLLEAVKKHTHGEGADVIITACPAPDIQELAVKMASKMGRVHFFGGLPEGNEHVRINTNLIHYNNLVVTGTTGSSLSDYELCLRLIEDKKIIPEKVITRRFSINQIKEAFDYALSGAGLKTIINV